jgi:methylase of polypeptide subunit release factors
VAQNSLFEKIKSRVIVTAKIGTNADLFPDILQIYVPEGSKILDMTYGKGVFWKNVDKSKYQLITNDLVKTADFHYDLRKTEFENGKFDVVVLDPPYIHMGKSVKQSINNCYNNNNSTFFKNQKEIQEFYFTGAEEAKRILKPKGILILKCQDMVEAGKQIWNHCTFMSIPGYICEDLFVLVQKTIPTMDPKWTKQYHARKNHSWFIILRKKV